MAQRRVEPTLEGVQVVRAIAALIVLCFHTASKLREDYDAHLPVLSAFRHFGMGGVDLFFVLSGFIITWITWDDIGRPSRAPRFLMKRVIRVMPIFWIVWLASAFIYLIVLNVDFYRCKPGDVFTLNAQAILLLDVYAHCVIPQAWTLSWEMMFYATFALFLCLPRVLLPFCLVVWAAAVLAAPLVGAAPAPGIALTPLGAFCLHFILGCFAGAATRMWPAPRLAAYSALVLGLATWAAAIAALMTDRVELTSQLVRVAVFGAPSAVLLYGVAALDVHKAVAYPTPLRLIGNASYVLYLGHITVLFFLQAAFPNVETTTGHMIWALGAIGLSIVTACVGHVFVERPVLHWLNGLQRFSLQAFTLLTAAAAMVGLAWLFDTMGGSGG